MRLLRGVCWADEGTLFQLLKVNEHEFENLTGSSIIRLLLDNLHDAFGTLREFFHPKDERRHFRFGVVGKLHGASF